MLINFNDEWADIRKQFDRASGLIAEEMKNTQLNKDETEELYEKQKLCSSILKLMTKQREDYYQQFR